MRLAEQRVFELLHEQALAAGIGQRAVLDAVAAGLEDDDLACRARRDKQVRHHVGLDQRELGAAGADAEHGVFAACGQTGLETALRIYRTRRRYCAT